MSILIVNDDGIHAKGILELAQYLMVDNRITVCAPDRNWSYSSHFMTTGTEISAKRVDLDGLRGVDCWAISGSPADCVCLAVNELMKKPDVVISGINRGENLGVADILSSGTFNAAACARRLGIPSAAISLARITDDFSDDYSHAARFAVQIANTLLSGIVPNGIVLNVNVPGLETYPTGVKITNVGKTTYNEIYHPLGEPEDHIYRQEWMDDGSTQPEEGTDAYWNERGYITVSPVSLPASDKEMMKTLLGYDFSI